MITNKQWHRKADEVCLAFPWYRQLLDSGKADGQLPLMNAETLDRYYYGTPPADAFAVYRTSGTSSGVRKAIVYSEEDEQQYLAIKTRLFAELTNGTGIRRALADMGTGHAAATSLDIFRGLGMEAEAIPFEEPIGRHIEKLESFKPELLYTMPSILDRIVQASAAPEAYGVKRIILVGETASPEWRRRAAEQFGLKDEDVIDTYGSIEIGTIAYYSHRHGLYLFVEGIAAEGLRAEELQEGLEPLAANESILVLTSFVRNAFPALRFVTYDVVRDLQTVEADGVTRQAFSGIVKRVGKELKHGEKISVYDIEEAVYRFLSRAEVVAAVIGRRLQVDIYSPEARPELLPVIQQAVEESIPEIGAMIKGGLLENVQVSFGGKRPEAHGKGSVKGKKLRTGSAEGMNANES